MSKLYAFAALLALTALMACSNPTPAPTAASMPEPAATATPIPSPATLHGHAGTDGHIYAYACAYTDTHGHAGTDGNSQA